MSDSQTYERFPVWIVLVCSLVSWSIYAMGAFILARLSIWLAIPYLLFVLWLEVRLLRTACVDCAYYGATCAFGKGRLCAAAFERGDPQRFGQREASWAAILPDFLVSILPAVGGILLLVLRGWDWLIAALLILLVVFAFAVTGLVRGALACRHCRQRELGCPAYQLFAGGSHE
jgi:hypothetical protein